MRNEGRWYYTVMEGAGRFMAKWTEETEHEAENTEEESHRSQPPTIDVKWTLWRTLREKDCGALPEKQIFPRFQSCHKYSNIVHILYANSNYLQVGVPIALW